MLRPDPFAAIASEEEFVAAACAAASTWVPDLEADLHTMAAAHLAVATRWLPRPRRWLKLLANLRATLAAAIGTEMGALTWLRKQQQRLLDAYVDLEASPALGPLERQLLREELVPAAFERF